MVRVGGRIGGAGGGRRSQAARSLGHMEAWATRAQGRVGALSGIGGLETGSYAGRDARCTEDGRVRVPPLRRAGRGCRDGGGG